MSHGLYLYEDVPFYDTTILKFDTVLQTFRTNETGIYMGKINDKQNQQAGP